MSTLTRKAKTHPVIAKLRGAAADPMWADHAEVRKDTLAEAADYIEYLTAELFAAYWEANNAGSELLTTSNPKVTKEALLQYGARDARLASASLKRLMNRVEQSFAAKGL